MGAMGPSLSNGAERHHAALEREKNLEPLLATDFFDWEDDEMEKDAGKPEPTRMVKMVGGVILLMVVAFVLILMWKGVQWAWNLEL